MVSPDATNKILHGCRDLAVQHHNPFKTSPSVHGFVVSPQPSRKQARYSMAAAVTPAATHNPYKKSSPSVPSSAAAPKDVGYQSARATEDYTSIPVSATDRTEIRDRFNKAGAILPTTPELAAAAATTASYQNSSSETTNMDGVPPSTAAWNQPAAATASSSFLPVRRQQKSLIPINQTSRISSVPVPIACSVIDLPFGLFCRIWICPWATKQYYVI
jgi:hypothetical protein